MLIKTTPPGESAKKKTRGWLIGLLLLAGTGTGAAGCSSDAPAPPVPPPPRVCIPGETLFNYRLPFQLDYRTAGEMTFSSCFDDLEGTLVLAGDAGFLRGGQAYAGTGKLYAFPESGHVLYTWKIPVQEVEERTCPEGNATLSLSLSARQGGKELSGGVSATCGPSTTGRRSFKIMRLSGVLEETEEP